MSTYVEDALVIVNNKAEVRITVEAGCCDDQYRDCLRLLLDVKGARGEMRIPYGDVMTLAKRLLELARGRKLKLNVRTVA